MRVKEAEILKFNNTVASKWAIVTQNKTKSHLSSIIVAASSEAKNG